MKGNGAVVHAIWCFQVPYKVLPKEELTKQREKALREVQDVLGVDEDTAMRLLRKYKW